MDIQEIRNRAREASRGSCRVCPVCNGAACAGEVPGMGGAGAGLSFRRNVEALAALRLKTRLVHQVRHPEMSVEILGLTLSLPLLIAPIGGLAFNLGGALSEADYQEAVVAGADQAGILAGTPDGAPPEVMETGLACARRHGGRALAFIKPWAVSEIIQKMEMAAEAGCRVVACDLESIGLITLRQMGRPAYAKDARELAEIAGAAHRLGLKFVLKGVMSREDALAGLEAGVDGLVVSNHGGRVLDGTPGTAEVLPQIAGAVRGRLALLADGGVRSGVDILKMLALGAEAVFIGRPYAVAAIGGGAAGVDIYTGQYRSQLEQALIMTGCPGVAMAGPHLLDRPTAGDLYAS